MCRCAASSTFSSHPRHQRPTNQRRGPGSPSLNGRKHGRRQRQLGVGPFAASHCCEAGKRGCTTDEAALHRAGAPHAVLINGIKRTAALITSMRLKYVLSVTQSASPNLGQGFIRNIDVVYYLGAPFDRLITAFLTS